MRTIKHVPITWIRFQQTCLDMAVKLQKDPRFADARMVFAIPRGGLVPASLVAYALELEISIETTTDWSSKEDVVIVIDDICDTGRTFAEIKQHFPNAICCSVYAKMKGISQVDHYGQVVDQDHWLIFPWAPNDGVNR